LNHPSCIRASKVKPKNDLQNLIFLFEGDGVIIQIAIIGVKIIFSRQKRAWDFFILYTDCMVLFDIKIQFVQEFFKISKKW
jgi:hypothetical protein